jgi:hypothetical protein
MSGRGSCESSHAFAYADEEHILLVQDSQSFIVYLSVDHEDCSDTCVPVRLPIPSAVFFPIVVSPPFDCLEGIEDELLATAVSANKILVHCIAQLRRELQKAEWPLVSPIVVSAVPSSRYWEGILMFGNRGIVSCGCAVAIGRAAVIHDVCSWEDREIEGLRKKLEIRARVESVGWY